MNIYAPNMGAAKYINQLITKVKTYLDSNTLIEGEIKSFQDRQKLEEYVTTKPVLQEILRRIL